MKGFKFFIRLMILIFALLLATIGVGFSVPSYNIYACILFLVNNIFYSIKDLENRIVFLILQITMFVFLIGKPFIYSMNGQEIFEGYPIEIQVATTICLLLSIVAMTLYTFIHRKIKWRDRRKELVCKGNFNGWNKEKVNSIRVIANIITFVTFTATMMVVVEKIGYKQVYSLSEYYVNYKTSLPIIIYKLGDVYLISFFLYLATLPSKKESRVQIILFFVYSTCTILYGVRNILILNIMIYIIYCVIRNSIGDEKWITKKVVVICSILLPFIIIALQGFDYIRRDVGFNLTTLNSILSIDLFKDFFESQGASSAIIPLSMKYQSYLGEQPVPYSIGVVYNYITNNMVTSTLFGFSPIKQNTVEMATYGAHLGSRLAYLDYSVSYLKGVGMGSSYIAELFVDFSYSGIVFGSIFISWLSMNIINFIGKNPIKFAFGLVVIRWLLYVPRDTFFNWFIQAFSLMNIIFVLFVSVCSGFILNKERKR